MSEPTLRRMLFRYIPAGLLMIAVLAVTGAIAGHLHAPTMIGTLLGSFLSNAWMEASR
jgi:hypothetical protein